LALVLQGDGAYELGVARALYEDGEFAPDAIAGVSIGTITAVLLALPADRHVLRKNPTGIVPVGWPRFVACGGGPARPVAEFATQIRLRIYSVGNLLVFCRPCVIRRALR
jgi:hypothetical protein